MRTRWVALFVTVLINVVVSSLHAAEPLSAELQQKIAAYAIPKAADGTPFLNCAKAIPALFGDQAEVGGEPNPQAAAAIVALAERLPRGGAIHLGPYGGNLDFRRLQDGILVTGGGRGGLTLASGQKDLQLLFVGPGVAIVPGPDGAGPLRNLLMAFGHCGRIEGDVADSAFIAAVGGWQNAFRATARVDDTLFLWFSYNWNFSDYNAHLKAPDVEWWKKNCQVYFNLKGGGKNTRVYLMIETNYGNPGTGVWLENCDGLALYHGATERSSAQGPGVYYLLHCRNCQLGLRRIFPGSAGGGSAAMPLHALTVEGGRGNIVHVFSDFAKSYGDSLANSDPALQLWGASFDYEVKGIDSPGILRFAVTPLNNMPEGKEKDAAAKLAEDKAGEWVQARNKKSGMPVTPEAIEGLKDRIRNGRDAWWSLNARHETTLAYGGQDLTEGGAKLEGGRKLPPPPSIPATDAPTKFRPLYYTLEPDYGKALLDAGADPTGKKPSDDAFAKILYGLGAAEVEKLVKEVRGGNKEAYDKLHPVDPNRKGKGDQPARIQRGTLEVPAGTFLLTKTLHFDAGNGSMVGAGPDKTVLRFQGDIVGVKQWRPGRMANFAVEGGRVGLAITGADHNAPAGAFQKSYIAGQDYYNLTFRGQTFAGIHIGTDDPEVMGGAEFDQNKFVNLKFLHTGAYGIYMNHTMLDKWLCLGAEFVGQKKAGIAIKFNNLIHGGLYSCRFENIDGPGIDFMGGNPELAYRPYVVMVDQCEFLECGNAEQPCVDYGYGDLMSFTRTKIVTKSKTVKAGYIGSAQHCEDVTIDVNLPESAPAMLLRAVRHGNTARCNGHILRGVTANGPVAWVNDANSQNAMYRKTLQLRKPETVKADGTLDLNWDANPSAHELAPPNGWVHPYVLYRSRFADREYKYALLNVDVDANKVLRELDLSPLE